MRRKEGARKCTHKIFLKILTSVCPMMNDNRSVHRPLTQGHLFAPGSSQRLAVRILLVLGLCLACSALELPGSPKTANIFSDNEESLEVDHDFAQLELAPLEGVNGDSSSVSLRVKFTVEGPVEFYATTTPFGGMWGDMFKFDDPRISYDGPQVFFDATAGELVKLQEGESRSIVVNLGEIYDLSVALTPTQDAPIQVSVHFQSRVWFPSTEDGQPAPSSIVASNAITAPLHPTPGDRLRRKRHLNKVRGLSANKPKRNLKSTSMPKKGKTKTRKDAWKACQTSGVNYNCSAADLDVYATAAQESVDRYEPIIDYLEDCVFLSPDTGLVGTYYENDLGTKFEDADNLCVQEWHKRMRLSLDAWFGGWHIFDVGIYDDILSNLIRTNAAVLGKKEFPVVCPYCNPQQFCFPGVVAYVYPNELAFSGLMTQYLCPIFFVFSDKANVVAHEISHFHEVGCTFDYCYGSFQCQSLAVYYPTFTPISADSYALFSTFVNSYILTADDAFANGEDELVSDCRSLLKVDSNEDVTAEDVTKKVLKLCKKNVPKEWKIPVDAFEEEKGEPRESQCLA